MQAHERISEALQGANDNGRPALVPFITACLLYTSDAADECVNV